jgi:hypothetical protein
MKSYQSLLLPVILAITLASCGKDEMATPDVVPEIPAPVNPGSGTGSSKIQGTWTFAGVRLIATATVTVDNDKTITYTDYTTFNNAGTIVIDAKKMTSTGFTYSIDAVSKAMMYEGGELTGEFEMPVKMTMPPVNSVSNYKQIGADSVYFEDGFIEGTDGGTPVQPDASGSKVTWLGDTLVLTSYPYKVSQKVQDGVTYKTVSSGKSEMKLVKKK